MPARHSQSAPLRIALIGIDGAGKTTAARYLADQFTLDGAQVRLCRNPGGRRTLDTIARRLGSSAETMFGARLLSRYETVVRAFALLGSLASMAPADVEIHDRYLYCQLAANAKRGVAPGLLLRLLRKFVPRPDFVLYFEISPARALERIEVRGTDTETLEDLRDLDVAYCSLRDFGSFRLVQADRPVQDVHRQIVAICGPALTARQEVPAPAGRT
jgi:dTMP kinase